MKGLGIGKSSFEKNIKEEVSQFLHVIKSNSHQDFDCHHIIQTAVSNIICSIAFGKRFEYQEKDFEQLMALVNENMRLVGGTSLVNYFPFLETFPTDPFKTRQTLNTVEKVQKVTRSWVDHHKATLDSNNPRDIIDLYLIQMQERSAQGQSTTFDGEFNFTFTPSMYSLSSMLYWDFYITEDYICNLSLSKISA